MHIVSVHHRFRSAARVTQGCEKWLEVARWGDIESCAAALRAAGVKLYAGVPGAAQTLAEFPEVNSRTDGTSVWLRRRVHLGLAVSIPNGLVVPVIRDVDKKSVLELSRELEALASKARQRKASAEDLQGGTFTISNQGGIGSGHFTPIVNVPEVAILGLGRGAMRAVVRENRIEPRLMLPLGLSYDHRVIDGGAAARFMVELVEAFERFKEEDVKT